MSKGIRKFNNVVMKLYMQHCRETGSSIFCSTDSKQTFTAENG
jgi:hypothetical protein